MPFAFVISTTFQSGWFAASEPKLVDAHATGAARGDVSGAQARGAVGDEHGESLALDRHHGHVAADGPARRSEARGLRGAAEGRRVVRGGARWEVERRGQRLEAAR